MPTTQEIIDAAQKLGQLIQQHQAATNYEEAVAAIEANPDAKSLLMDYNKLMQTVMEKQQTNQPIEVDEKHKLEELQTQVIDNQILKNLQVAEMDYADLRRKINQAIQPQPQQEPQSPIIT